MRPDNGKSFVDGDFEKWCTSIGVKVRPTSNYNPQGNLAERHHRQINKMLDESYSNPATIEDDIFEFCHSHNPLKRGLPV